MNKDLFPTGSPGDNFRRHETFMLQCIALATVAAGNGESAVGSLLVLEDQVIATGIEAVKKNNDFTRHAEIECIRAAGEILKSRYLDSCTLYSTHEPCIMCSYLIRQSRIPRVVFGCFSGEKGGLSSRLPLLTETGFQTWPEPPELITGILENLCRQLK